MITFEQIQNIATFLGIPAILAGIIIAIYQRRANTKERAKCEKQKSQEEREREAQRLLVTGVLASIDLGIINAEAIRTGRHNGEMAEALKTANQFRKDTNEFLAKYFNG